MAITPGGNIEPEANPSIPFSSILATVVALTLLAGSVAFWLSGKETLNEHQFEFWVMSKEVCSHGFTVIFGMLGFKLFDRKSN